MLLTEVEDENNNEKCDLCKSKEKDILKFGKFFKLNKYRLHQFCALFASALPISGKNSNGNLIFLEEDIRKEIVRSQRVKCDFCKLKGASIKCAKKSCRKSFHYQCSLESNCSFQDFKSFLCWCFDHNSFQNSPKEELSEDLPKSLCGICLSSATNKESQLLSSCCGGLFHFICVSQLSEAPRCYFKCPLCNNRDVFNREMKKFGIHVPEHDAERNGVVEDTSKVKKQVECNAKACSCEDGRDYDEADTIYEIILCHSCELSGIHIQCGKLKLSDPVYLCENCKGPEIMVHDNSAEQTGRRKSLRSRTQEEGSLKLDKREPPLKRDKISNREKQVVEVINPVTANNQRKQKKTESLKKPSVSLDQEAKQSKRGRNPAIAQEMKVTENQDLGSNSRFANKRALRGQAAVNKANQDISIETPKKSGGKVSKKSVTVNHNGEAKEESDSIVPEEVPPKEKNRDSASQIDVKNNVGEEELDTELSDLANQINFDFEIPSSPLKTSGLATPKKGRTPAKRMILNANSTEPTLSPLKENIDEQYKEKENKSNQSGIKAESSKRRSVRKKEKFSDVEQTKACMLNLNQSFASDSLTSDPVSKENSLSEGKLMSNPNSNTNTQKQNLKQTPTTREDKSRPARSSRLRNSDNNHKNIPNPQPATELKSADTSVESKTEKLKSQLSDTMKRKNQIERAKIRVKINELRDQLDKAVTNKDFGEAAKIKATVDSLEKDQRGLEVKSIEEISRNESISQHLSDTANAAQAADIPNISNNLTGKRKRDCTQNSPLISERVTKKLRSENCDPSIIGNQNITDLNCDSNVRSKNEPVPSKILPSASQKQRTKSSTSSDKEKNVHLCKQKRKNKENLIERTPDVQMTPNQESQETLSHIMNKKNPKSLEIAIEQNPVEEQNLGTSRRVSRQAINKKASTEISKPEDSVSNVTERIPSLENISFKNLHVNVFNINSSRVLKILERKTSNHIILHINRYILAKSGKSHSKRLHSKRRLDIAIDKLSNDLKTIGQELSDFMTQKMLRESTKFILHLNLSSNSIKITKKRPGEEQQSEKSDSNCAIEELKQNSNTSLRRSARSKTEIIEKPKNSVSKRKEQSMKAPKTLKSSAQKSKTVVPGTAPYPYASETTLEEELFYQICPLKPTYRPKGISKQSSGRTGEKRNNTRRILITMQKLGRSPILDRPLSFVAFTFDGSDLISHETVEELKERTYGTSESNAEKPRKKKVENKYKINKKQSVKTSKVKSSVRKNKVSIWKSAKFNSRIKTMISKNGTIQLTVNKDSTTEAPNGLNVSKYFKIRRTSSFSPASHKSTSPAYKNDAPSENNLRPVSERKPIIPKILSQHHNPTQMITNQEPSTTTSPMKLKIPKDLWVKARKDERLHKLGKKTTTLKQRKNSSPKTVKVKYKNLYGRVIEYAKNLPRIN